MVGKAKFVGTGKQFVAVMFTALAAACATNAPTAAPAKAPEEVVRERAQARWNALVQGDVKAAYEFFAYWNSKKGQITWASGSGFPPNRADVADQVTASPYPAIFGAEAVGKRAKILLAGVAPGGTILNTIFFPSVQKALNGEGSVDSIFKAASTQVQAELDKK